LQGSENGRVVTIVLGVDRDWRECKDRQLWVEIVVIVYSGRIIFGADTKTILNLNIMY